VHNDFSSGSQVKGVSTDAEPTVVDPVRRATRVPSTAADADVLTFVDVYRANVSAITAYFARRCREPQIVADLTSETFVEALGSLSSFDSRRGTPRGWLFGIARIVFARHWAAVQSGRDFAERAPRIVLDQDETDELAARIDDQRDGRRLLDKLSAFPERERTALELVDLDGLSPREAARALEVSPGVLRARLFRGRSRLRNEWRSQ
jgi:RNA polymerase sigma-70 factor (ECF subfamily)